MIMVEKKQACLSGLFTIMGRVLRRSFQSVTRIAKSCSRNVMRILDFRLTQGLEQFIEKKRLGVRLKLDKEV